MKNITSVLLSAFLILALFNSAFAQSEKKAAYGILIDNTRSLQTQFPEVLMIGKGIVEQIHNRGLVSLFIFEPQRVDKRNSFAMITPGTEWSQDKNLLGNYIENLAVVPGQTTLMDAINSMAA